MTFDRALAQLLLLVSAAGAARAEAIYRCGSQYSHRPCPGAQVLDLQDDRSDEQRREGHEAAAQQAALAERLTREREQREQREARQRPDGPVGIRGERGGDGRPGLAHPSTSQHHAAKGSKPTPKKASKKRQAKREPAPAPGQAL
jgi:hypothetical protein